MDNPNDMAVSKLIEMLYKQIDELKQENEYLRQTIQSCRQELFSIAKIKEDSNG